MKVSVSIVTHQSRAWITRCLDALDRQGPAVHEVLVLDSASRDGTAELVAARHPEVALDRAAANVGFARGHNRNWSRAQGDALLVLNPDVILRPGAVARLVAVLERSPRVGAVAPRLLAMDAPERIDSAGILRSRGRTRFVDRGRGEPRAAFDEEEVVFGACGAAVLLRREALDAVSRPGETPFAEHFYMYYEDVDLAWRLQRAGFHTRYVPQAEALHVRGGSGGDPAFVEYHLVRNRVWCTARNASAPELVRELPGLLLFEGAKLLQSLRRPHLRRALRDQLTGLPAAWAARDGGR